MISTRQENEWQWGVEGDAGRSVHQSKSQPAPSDILLRNDLCHHYPSFFPAAPWIKPSDPGELITKVCLRLPSLCCTCNYTVLNLGAVEVKVGEDNHHTPDECV